MRNYSRARFSEIPLINFPAVGGLRSLDRGCVQWYGDGAISIVCPTLRLSKSTSTARPNLPLVMKIIMIRPKKIFPNGLISHDYSPTSLPYTRGRPSSRGRRRGQLRILPRHPLRFCLQTLDAKPYTKYSPFNI